MASSLRLFTACKNLHLPKALCGQTYIAVSSYSSRTTAAEQMEAYWKRNKERNRPLSPHLTIYKFHQSMALSISNRITAGVVTGAMYIGPLIYLFGSKDFAGYIDLIKSSGPVGMGVLMLSKLSVAFCFSYHFWASIRHFIWDLAKGLRYTQVKQSGYVIMAATVLLTAALMFM